MFRNGKFIVSESRSAIAQGIKVGITKGTFWDNGNVLKLENGDSCKTINLLKIIELYPYNR